jgi:tetrahydromethanopterin S-methyltransferase subunit G
MSDIKVSDKESQDLELHVELCAQRYAVLERRLDSLNTKVEQVHSDVLQGQKSLNTVIISSAATIVVAILGAVSAAFMMQS